MRIGKWVFGVMGTMAALAAALPASAQMRGAANENAWYIGAAIGQSRARDACTDPNLFGGVAGCDYKDTAVRLMGGYQWNRNFALELGYTDLGKASVPGASIDPSAFDLVAVGMLPVGPVSLLGKIGGYRGESKCSGCPASFTETNTGGTFGLGVQYDLTRQFVLRGEWQRFSNMGGGQFNTKFDVDAWTFGGLYRF